MTDLFSKLERVLIARRGLSATFKQQHQTLHGDRNLTAGKIYENTKQLEDEAARLVEDARRKQYADAWVERWPL